MSKVRLTGDGTPNGTRVIVLDDEGNPVVDISNDVQEVKFVHEARGLPKVYLTVILGEVDVVGEHTPALGKRFKEVAEATTPEDWRDPRVGEVRRI